jgi:uncharacterized membrane protein YbhN (UPF0104 family)
MLYTGLTRVFKAANERFVTPLFPKVLGGPGRKVLESIETYRRHPRTVIIGLVCCMAGDIVTAVAVALCLGAVGVTGVSFVRVLWIMAATKASGMLPITMSGLGMPQVTFVGLMVACGVAQERAFAANIINLGVLIPMVLAGMGILLVELRGSGSRQTK